MKSIAICGFLYKIKFVKDLRNQNNDSLLGEADHINNIISIQKGLSKQQTDEVLMHETLHAIFANTGVRHLLQRDGSKDIDQLEELLIQMISPALTAALKTKK